MVITDRLRTIKLGKRRPRFDARTLKLSKYIKALAPPPAQAGYIEKVREWPMYFNDAYGDCVAAAAAHMVNQWTAYANSSAKEPTNADVLKSYEDVGGFVPGDPNTDNGMTMLDYLNYWQQVGLGGHKIFAFVQINPNVRNEIKQAIDLFGNCYVGVGLPITAQQPIAGENGLPVWSTPPNGPIGQGAPYSWGGHCVPLVGYGTDSQGNHGYEAVSWGQLFDVTPGFGDDYIDEAYAVLSMDWIEQSGQAPSGFDLAQLQADLALIA